MCLKLPRLGLGYILNGCPKQYSIADEERHSPKRRLRFDLSSVAPVNKEPTSNQADGDFSGLIESLRRQGLGSDDRKPLIGSQMFITNARTNAVKTYDLD